MKNQIPKICAMVLLITALLLVPAGAQSFNSIKGSIPFSFTVGKTTFPAGKYVVQNPFRNGSRGIRIINEENKECLIRLATPVQISTPKEETTLIFHRYGDQYFFSEIWIAGDVTGMKIPQSKAERELAAIYFQQQKNAEIVSLVASAK